eukprot:5030707-Prymnesium_polylepis.1
MVGGREATPRHSAPPSCNTNAQCLAQLRTRTRNAKTNPVGKRRQSPPSALSKCKGQGRTAVLDPGRATSISHRHPD